MKVSKFNRVPPDMQHVHKIITFKLRSSHNCFMFEHTDNLLLEFLKCKNSIFVLGVHILHNKTLMLSDLNYNLIYINNYSFPNPAFLLKSHIFFTHIFNGT